MASSTLLALFGTTLLAWASPASASGIPSGRTPVAQLASAGFAHQQVLRIDQDFHPNNEYEIALDAWVDKANPGAIAEIRMWWLDTGSSDERSPFGKGVRRHIGIRYDESTDGEWTVKIKQGRKEFAFDVSLDDSGSIEAFANVEAGGSHIDRCRVESSRLVAKKILGIPAGLKRLDVTCVDAQGDRHRGHVRHRKVHR